MTATITPQLHASRPFAIGSFQWGFLVFGGFALAAALFLYADRPWNLTTHFMIGAPVGRDFSNFWTGGRLALDGRLDLLADFRGYNDFIDATFHYHPKFDERVFSYPPHILPFLVPFAALPYIPAALLWTALNLWLIGRTVRLLAPGALGAQLAAWLSPAVVSMVAFGQFGGVLAFLATYVLTRAQTRPRLAGLCLGLISVKPHLAVSFGVFLLLTGRWRAVLWSLSATAGLVAISLAAFGLQPWINFVHWTIPFQEALLSIYVHAVLTCVISVYKAARLYDLGELAGYALQFIYAAIVLGGSAALAIRRGMTPRVLALALLAALSAVPYFATYDLAIAAPALAVAMFAPQPAESRPFLPLLPASLFLFVPVIATIFDVLHVPAGSVITATVVLFALLREALAPPSPAGRTEVFTPFAPMVKSV